MKGVGSKSEPEDVLEANREELQEMYGGGRVIGTPQGANPEEMASEVERLAANVNPGVAESQELISVKKGVGEEDEIENIGGEEYCRIRRLLDDNPVMLFMKGTPDEPRCGFSRKVVHALNEVGVKFGSFDVLSDVNVRQSLKTFSTWPTFPQLYCKGELLGGCDITLHMHNSGELEKLFVEKGVLLDTNAAGFAS